MATRGKVKEPLTTRKARLDLPGKIYIGPAYKIDVIGEAGQTYRALVNPADLPDGFIGEYRLVKILKGEHVVKTDHVVTVVEEVADMIDAEAGETLTFKEGE